MSTKIISINILATIVTHKLNEVAARKNEISIAQLEAMPLFSKKAISLKANLLKQDSTGIIAEPNKIIKLLDSIHKNITHRPRPIKNKNQTVIFTGGKCGYFFEQILLILIGMKFRTVQNTSLRN